MGAKSTFFALEVHPDLDVYVPQRPEGDERPARDPIDPGAEAGKTE
ncbi:MAG: hypothetical protein U0599_01040 [Vicinamibacteria bacterium]